MQRGGRRAFLSLYMNEASSIPPARIAGLRTQQAGENFARPGVSFDVWLVWQHDPHYLGGDSLLCAFAREFEACLDSERRNEREEGSHSYYATRLPVILPNVVMSETDTASLHLFVSLSFNFLIP